MNKEDNNVKNKNKNRNWKKKFEKSSKDKQPTTDSLQKLKEYFDSNYRMV